MKFSRKRTRTRKRMKPARKRTRMKVKPKRMKHTKRTRSKKKSRKNYKLKGGGASISLNVKFLIRPSGRDIIFEIPDNLPHIIDTWEDDNVMIKTSNEREVDGTAVSCEHVEHVESGVRPTLYDAQPGRYTIPGDASTLRLDVYYKKQVPMKPDTSATLSAAA